MSTNAFARHPIGMMLVKVKEGHYVPIDTINLVYPHPSQDGTYIVTTTYPHNIHISVQELEKFVEETNSVISEGML